MMNSREKDLREAAAELLAAQAGSWERGSCYISAALAPRLNAAMKAVREALDLGGEPCDCVRGTLCPVAICDGKGDQIGDGYQCDTCDWISY